MNKLILIKTNVNMKNQLKLEWDEQFCQEEFYKLSKAESNVLA